MESPYTSRLSETLHKSELFSDLDPQALHQISKLAVHSHYRRKEFIINQGTPVESLRILCAGTAKFSYATSAGERFAFGWLRPGAVFGVGAFAAPAVEKVTVQAVDECETLEWSVTVAKSISLRFPNIVNNAVGIMQGYWDLGLSRLHELLTSPAPYRVACVIDRSMDEIGLATDDGTTVNMLDEDIAEFSGTSLFTVSRMVQRWSRLGLLVKSRGKIVISPGVRLCDHVDAPRRIEAGGNLEASGY